MNKEELKPNWKAYEKYPTWSCVNSRELSEILGVSLQTINNWKMRKILPNPDSSIKRGGNKNYYRISSIRSWLEGIPEEEIHWRWVEVHMSDDFKTLEQARDTAKLCWDIYGIKRT